MSYIYEVFEHLLRLVMCIWLHNHTITATDISPDLWELAKILPNASVQTMRLCFEAVNLSNCITCPCHTYMRCLSTFSGCGWAYGSQLTFMPPQMLPKTCESFGWNPTWCKCANHATTLWLRLKNLSNCIPHPCDTYMRCLSTFTGCGWAYGFTLTRLPPQILP